MRKRKKKNGSLVRFLVPSIHVEVPERAKRMIWSVAMFSFALVFLFAFFGKAGAVGNWLFEGMQFFIGKTAYVFPLFLIVTGLVLWNMRQYSSLLAVLALCLLALSTSGILSTLARARGEDVLSLGGWTGSLASLPVFRAFGFWVGEIIFFALATVGGIILWHVVPHEKKAKEEESSLGEAAKEKVKKIFEPKFEILEVEPEPIIGEVQRENESPENAPSEEKKQRRKGVSLALGNYKVPPPDLLEYEKGLPNAGDVKTYSAIIKKTLQNFDIPVEISEVSIGPAVTQYAFKPAEGIKLSRITALQSDLALALASHPLRIEAPIPGRALVGIEIPNKTRALVRLRNLLEQREYQESSANLLFALGKDVSGTPVYTDLARMPHLLVAGATGSGKTIGLSSMIISLIYRNPPSRLRFILVDPKRVEFPVYNDLPHLLTPVVFDVQRTVNALKWLIKEMERRFSVFSEMRVRDLPGYHRLAGEKKRDMEEIPYIVCMIDELADLMATRGKELEAMVVRLAQMARAVGIHLVLATQRPSVEVITGLIKANITSRIAFQVASQVDSRTILDVSGAEKLIGQGDMLFVTSESTKPRRIQGSYVSEREVKRVVEWIARETGGAFWEDMDRQELGQIAQDALEGKWEEEADDPFYEEAKRVVVESGKASASLLQRRLKVGYARAARILDILEKRGVVGPQDGAKPREVYASRGPTGQEQWINP